MATWWFFFRIAQWTSFFSKLHANTSSCCSSVHLRCSLKLQIGKKLAAKKKKEKPFTSHFRWKIEKRKTVFRSLALSKKRESAGKTCVNNFKLRHWQLKHKQWAKIINIFHYTFARWGATRRVRGLRSRKGVKTVDARIICMVMASTSAGSCRKTKQQFFGLCINNSLLSLLSISSILHCVPGHNNKQNYIKRFCSSFFIARSSNWFTLVIMQFMNIPNTIVLFQWRNCIHYRRNFEVASHCWCHNCLIMFSLSNRFVFPLSRAMLDWSVLENSTKVVPWMNFTSRDGKNEYIDIPKRSSAFYVIFPQIIRHVMARERKGWQRGSEQKEMWRADGCFTLWALWLVQFITDFNIGHHQTCPINITTKVFRHKKKRARPKNGNAKRFFAAHGEN